MQAALPGYDRAMDMDNELIAEDTTVNETRADEKTIAASITDELLIEEISIDGMCGVY